MIIDAPRPEDIPALRCLWKEAFGDDEVFLDAFFSTAFSPERCRCITFSGQLAAALYWFDCEWDRHPVAYIYAVATDKVYRGRGLCHALMEDTHRHLLSHGYRGAALVPETEDLFSLYEKMGYRPFCYMDKVTVNASDTPAALIPLTKEDFCARRRQYLPAGGILQEGVTAELLACFAEFYAGSNGVMCVVRDGDNLSFQEYLGNREQLPDVLAALGTKEATVHLPGAKPFAMYYSPETECPTYLGICLG